MLIDLTHTLEEGITVYPGTPDPLFTPLSSIQKDGFAERRIFITTHTGTHIDAPCHILPGTKSLDQFTLDKFTGKGVALDCSGVSSITLDFLQSREAEIQDSRFILFYTGWQDKWNTPGYFDEFPTLTTEGVEWLLLFQPKALGFDTISVDRLNDEALPNHHLLLNKEVLIIENLSNLDQLVGRHFQFYCIPLKIGAADASPVRAFAQVL